MSENETVKVSELAEAPEEPQPIDPKLLGMIQGCKLLVRADDLLSNCLFPGGAASELVDIKNFLKKLHEPMYKDAQAHPDFKRATTPPGEIKAMEKAEAKRQRKLKKIEMEPENDFA